MLLFLAVGATGGVAAAAAAGAGWPWELFAHGLPAFGAAVTLSGAALMAMGRVVAGSAALTVAVFAAVRVFGVDYAPPAATALAGPQARTAPNELTLLWCNVQRNREALARVAALAEEAGADVVALSEVPRSLTEAETGALFPAHPHRADGGEAADGRWTTRVMLLSRPPLSDVRLRAEPPFTSRPYVTAKIAAPAGPLTLIAAHPTPPLSPGMLAQRDALMAAVADDAPAHGGFIVLGDFNVTPWSPSFAALPGRRAGRPGLESTWLTRFPVLGLVIDHVMLGANVDLDAYQVGPPVGSDHLPLIVEVRA
ncbi:MAG: endonuclease/exonuclease/phosphatase family protein [Caulobacterales bacterium]|nr:endonuclease/exonuclease/phosphatase family protein [Caulobacterales bacterium]